MQRPIYKGALYLVCVYTGSLRLGSSGGYMGDTSCMGDTRDISSESFTSSAIKIECNESVSRI